MTAVNIFNFFVVKLITSFVFAYCNSIMRSKKRQTAIELLKSFQTIDIQSDFESEDEYSSDCDVENLSETDGEYEIDSIITSESKDGTKWSRMNKNETIQGGARSENVFREKVGIRNFSKTRIKYPIDSWKLLFTNKMFKLIIDATNEKAKANGFNLNLDEKELQKFIGLVFLRGVLNMRKTTLEFIWSNEFGIPYFKSIMSRNRFTNILKYLRFENHSNRSHNKQDPFIHLRELFESFTANSAIHYIPNCFITIDEQLVPSKNRCRFLQYIPSKPDKYGIKVWVAVDCKTKYICNQFPYVGKDERRQDNERLGVM